MCIGIVDGDRVLGIVHIPKLDRRWKCGKHILVEQECFIYSLA
jgi:hypothetical protein